MDKEREIESMAKKICKNTSVGCNFPTCMKCGIKDTCKARIYATRAIEAGYGDTKQAVRGFAEKVRFVIDDLVELIFDDGANRCIIGGCHKSDDIPCGASICIEENRQAWKSKIDDLLAEVTGE